MTKKIFLIGAIAILSAFALKASADDSNAIATADVIISKAVEQTKRAESRPATPEYKFTKVTETQALDAKGHLKEHKKSLYEMIFKSGFLSKKRVPAPGETIAEAKKKDAQENSEPLKLGKYKGASRSDFVNFLTPELIGKYVFTLVNRTNLNGRTAFEIAFRPRQKDLPAKELAERVLNQAAGKIWIDAEDFELAKAQVHIDSEVTVGGGLLGSLKRAFFALERTRLPEGIWFDRAMKTDYEARKLTESTRVISVSEFSNFHRLSPEG